VREIRDLRPPERVTVPTCIGCGAMERWGTCEAGCSEHRLELVSAAEFDALEVGRSAVRARLGACRPVAEALAGAEPGPEGWQAAYRASQRAALAVLSRHQPSHGSDEPAEHVTTWWCAECGGIDAPQPCLGICVWRPADWVNRTAYEAARSRAAGERDVERAMVRLLRRVACVTPREGHWERNWRALHADAREALRASASLAAPGPASARDRRTAHADPA
jgi:hypothetical protein